MMKSGTSAPPSATSGDTAKTVLAAGGLLAAFGVASCCALPVALSLLGISAASLVGIGYLAAQYQRELLYGSVICLVAAGFLMWRQRQARLCAPGEACTRPAMDWSSKIAVLLAVGLLALTFWIEPPL
jgi:mercuric ion transport protein